MEEGIVDFRCFEPGKAGHTQSIAHGVCSETWHALHYIPPAFRNQTGTRIVRLVITPDLQ